MKISVVLSQALKLSMIAGLKLNLTNRYSEMPYLASSALKFQLQELNYGATFKGGGYWANL